MKALSPTFGGINLEDISAPRCFEIEQRLIEELDIPVFHDDQHGTAVVLLAGLLNAVKIVDKKLEDCKVVLCGIGAAGTACTKMLMAAGVRNIIGVDRLGAITSEGVYDNPFWQWYAEHTNPEQIQGSLSEVIGGADIFIGVSGPGVLKKEDVAKMARRPNRLRDGQPSTGNSSRRSRALCASDGDRTFRLSEPNQQRAVLSGFVPWIAGLQGVQSDGEYEACRSQGDRIGYSRG